MDSSRSFADGVEEVDVEALPEEFVDDLSELYEKVTPSRFLCGRYGITCFDFQEPPLTVPAATASGGGQSERRILVLAHGIGASKNATFGRAFREPLLAAGYTVLAYSFYGHGWSYAGREVVPARDCCSGGSVMYSEEVFLTQVEELLEFLLHPEEAVHLWVGHSTGGVVGPLFAASGSRPVHNLALISPAFWAEKPFLAKVLDGLHPASTLLLSNCACLHPLVREEYMKLVDLVFARDEEEGSYLYPKQHERAVSDNESKFEFHPQIILAILAINCTFLRGDLLQHHRMAWKTLARRGNSPRTLLLWGTRDVVVPFERAKDAVAWNPGRITLLPLEDMGHESLLEDPLIVARSIADFFRREEVE